MFDLKFLKNSRGYYAELHILDPPTSVVGITLHQMQRLNGVDWLMTNPAQMVRNGVIKLNPRGDPFALFQNADT